MHVHGYDQDKLRSQGVTPTHIIYSKISTFDTFLQMLMQVALDPQAQSQVREGEESEADVLKIVANLVSTVIKIKPDLSPTLTTPVSLKLLHALTLIYTDKEDLRELADCLMSHLARSQFEDKEKFPMMVEVVWHVKNIEGFERALSLSKTFKLYKTLTQIAYQSGEPDFYLWIHAVVDEGAYKLEWAMRTVYE